MVNEHLEEGSYSRRRAGIATPVDPVNRTSVNGPSTDALKPLNVELVAGFRILLCSH